MSIEGANASSGGSDEERVPVPNLHACDCPNVVGMSYIGPGVVMFGTDASCSREMCNFDRESREALGNDISGEFE